jgi:hypothetical protein
MMMAMVRGMVVPPSHFPGARNRLRELETEQQTNQMRHHKPLENKPAEPPRPLHIAAWPLHISYRQENDARII